MQLLAERLRVLDWQVTCVREPGGTTIGERVRSILLDPKLDSMTTWTELFLFMASRQQLVEEIIAPALKRGAAVISDRFLLSSIVYQGIAGDLGPLVVKRLARQAFGDWLPDLSLVVDLPAEDGLARAKSRGKITDRVEARGLSYAKKVRDGFLAARRMRLAGRSALIDGSGAVEQVAADIWREVAGVL